MWHGVRCCAKCYLSPMLTLSITAYDLASRFVGARETEGPGSNPLILAMLKLDQTWPAGDDVPWCSAFLNAICWLLNLPRSKKLNARSWLRVGETITLEDARVGFDVVILKRGDGPQPGADVTMAPGHVGFFAGRDEARGLVRVLSGNQGNSVSIASFPAARVLGVRRLLSARGGAAKPAANLSAMEPGDRWQAGAYET